MNNFLSRYYISICTFMRSKACNISMCKDLKQIRCNLELIYFFTLATSCIDWDVKIRERDYDLREMSIMIVGY